ncbi:helix-turn-helix transcriptional regulator [Thermopolyspora sp. NPDC052614]|uniref:helix-turn-helix domain-containing protein n=1 Tax=Thermopolyspora sp. NPDC052614 TaxID=3155682 RepID=UPI00341E513D
METFGEHARALMHDRGISLRRLAKQIHYDAGYLSKVLNGHKRPSLAMAELLDTALDTDGELLNLVWTERKWRAPTHGIDGELTPDDEERLMLTARRPSRVDAAVVDSLSTILAAQRRAEDALGSGPLLTPVAAQLTTIEDLVVDARGPLRPRLVDIASQWAEFLGWLHTSTGDADQASRWFDRASEWAAEAGNATMAATAFSFKGHLAFLLGHMGPAVGLSRVAAHDPSVWIGQRAYDAHQEARALAVMGDPTAERRLAEAAEMAAAVEEHRDRTPPWIYYYTAPFYLLERGWAYRLLGRDNERLNGKAIDHLTAGISALGDGRRSQWAAEYIYHLAFALFQTGEVGQACASADEAAMIARRTGSDRLLARLRGLHRRMQARWPKDPRVSELGDRLR